MVARILRVSTSHHRKLQFTICIGAGTSSLLFSICVVVPVLFYFTILYIIVNLALLVIFFQRVDGFLTLLVKLISLRPLAFAVTPALPLCGIR